jgi:hypothetical protein
MASTDWPLGALPRGGCDLAADVSLRGPADDEKFGLMYG